jgi:predicted ester cyclase
MGNPPTHRRMTIDTMELGRFEDGRMVEHWGVADRLGALVQLGLTPGGRRQAAS